MNTHIEKVKQEFSKQSSMFEAYMGTDLKKEFNKNTVNRMHPVGNETVLEVAAGTCAFGRIIAPHVSHITEFDVTEAMLAVGKSENEKIGVKNADYVIGEAERLPFADKTFDIVVSRLAFHHFADADAVFAEMSRAVKPGGKIVVADMLARDGVGRDVADKYETLRDPSHIRCITLDEFTALAEKHRCSVEHTSVTEIPMELNAWMDLTDVPEEVREQITLDMREDLSGNTKTGFSPYSNGNKIMFNQQWLCLIARKL